MAQGYEDSRFETPVDENLHCVICTEVLRDPVQCDGNEHHFCRSCITTHLRHSQNCPTCKDPLTIETLRRPQRFLANTLASLKISCENSERGCRKVVELGSLNSHVANCGFTPVSCSNGHCSEIINRCDKEIHESKVCVFREIKCEYCSEVVQYINYMEHTCQARQEIREMKANIADLKAELNEVRSTQQEMLRIMRNMMPDLAEINFAQDSEASSAQVLQAEVVVAGGDCRKSVEVFNMATKTWLHLSDLNEFREFASSVLYQDRMIVTGGFSNLFLDTIEELRLGEENGHWLESQMKLPRVSRGHVCVVHHDRLYVFGGSGFTRVYNEVHEFQLKSPHTSRLLTTMPQPLCSHGAEIVNDKVYIIGGSTVPFSLNPKNTVLMFDPTSKSFTELKPLPYAVSEMATVSWKNNVVVLGGVTKEHKVLKTVTLYNVATGSHRELPEMRKKRHGCTAVAVGDNIIVMGGQDEEGTKLKSVECYNFATNTWTELPAMAETRYLATAVVKYC